MTLLLMTVMTFAVASARDKVYRDASVLPANAQKILKQAFPKTPVSHIKVDSDLLGRSDYDVVLTDGSEIEFNKEGEWEEVDCGMKAVPSMFVLKSISSYVASNYKGARIVQIKKDRNKYEVELSTGIDLDFDRAGKFLRVDD